MRWEVELEAHEWMRHEHVIVFDGVCNWCNAWVTFLLSRDHRGTFKFATLQSEAAQRLMRSLNLSTVDYETFLLVERKWVYGQSTAALRIVRQLPGLWPILYVCVLIPRPIRDALYRWVARRRYAWMGRADRCRVPTPEEQNRFV